MRGVSQHSDPGGSHAGSLLSAGVLLRLAVVLAVFIAAIEIVARLAELRVRQVPFGAGVHIAWMAPLMNLVWFSGAAALAIAGRRIAPRLVTPQATMTLLTMPAFITVAWLIPKVQQEAALLLAIGLSVQTGRLLARRSVSVSRLAHSVFLPVSAVALAAIVVMLGGARLRESRALAAVPPSPTGAPNVLLLILDTVRSYSVSGYGYARPTTPTIDSLARSGVRFDRAIVPASWTMPSHATMFTARWPFELRTGPRTPLGPKYPTIAEAMADAGWATGGFGANHSYLTWEHGLERGFARFEGYPANLAMFFTATAIGRTLMEYNTFRKPLGYFDSPMRKTAADVNDGLLDWLDDIDDRPFFAMLNYFDAHHPYLPPEPYLTKFGPHGALRWRGGELVFREFSADEIALKQNQYDGGIAYVDAEIARLLAALDARGQLDNTVVIVTSDHGEHWGEHQRLSHGRSLYRQELQVPLVMTGPGIPASGSTVPDVVSLRDLPATILDAGVVSNRSVFPGASLLALARGSDDVPRSPAFSEDAPFGQRGARSLIADGLHYIRLRNGTEELYDLESDSLELHNVAGAREHASALRILRARMDSLTDGALPSDMTHRPEEPWP